MQKMNQVLVTLRLNKQLDLRNIKGEGTALQTTSTVIRLS